MRKIILLLFLILVPASAHAIALPTAPLDPVPNEVGYGSINPYLLFSQNEYVDLSSGLVTLNPKGLKMQMGTLALDISPAYHPNRGKFGTGEMVFSSFHALAYPSVDKAVYTLGMSNFTPGQCPNLDPYTEINVEEGEGELPCQFRYFPMGDLGYFAVNRFGQVSRAAFKVNDKKWQFGINGIVGALGAEIEVGDQGDKMTVYMIIRSDGIPVFLTTAEKEEGFRKKYKLLGDHRFGQIRDKKIVDRFVIQDENGIRYTFTSDQGFRAKGNYAADSNGRPVAWESRIETRKCYKILGLFGDCSPHLNFPGWKGKPFFLQKVEDPYGNEIKISSEFNYGYGKRTSIITTGKAVIKFTEIGNQVIISSTFGGNHPERKWIYNLDSEGRVVSIKDPDSNVTTYQYLGGDKHATVKAGQVFGDLEADAVIKVNDPLGGLAQFDSYYNSALRGTVVTESAGGNIGTIQKTVYLAPNTTIIFDYDGGTAYYDFEVKEGVRLLKEKRTHVDGKLVQETYHWEDDPENNLIHGASKIINTVDGQSFVTENVYDNHGRLVKSVDGLGDTLEYTYFCDDIPEDKRIISHQVRTVKRVKERLLESGSTASDAVEIEVKPFFPLKCETQTIYKKLDGLEIDISFSDIFLAMMGYNPIDDDLNNYIHSEIETEITHEYVVDKINEVINILNKDEIFSSAGPPMSIEDFKSRFNQAANAYIQNNCNANTECWVSPIGASYDAPNGDPVNGSIDEIDRFPEIQLAMNALGGMIVEKVMAVAGFFVGNVTTNPDYDLPYNDIYALTHDTLRSLLDLSPVKPDMPFLIGQIRMRVNSGPSIPLRRYLYELRPKEFSSLGDVVGGGPLLMEIDEKGVHTAYLYHYCDIMGMVNADLCGSLDPWRKEQINRQLLTARIRGKKPAQLYAWAVGFKTFLDDLTSVMGSSAMMSKISNYFTDSANTIDAELYGYDLEYDNLWFKVDTNLNGQFYEFSKANDLRRIEFLNGSYIAITPDYEPGYSTVTQETYDVTRNQVLKRTQYLNRLGQVFRVINPNKLTTLFEYGPNKKVTRQINPGGGVTQYKYDGLGRLINVWYPGGSEIGVKYGRELRSVLGGKDVVTNVGSYYTSHKDKPAMKTYRDFNDKVVEIELYGDSVLSYKYRYDTFGNLIQSAGPEGGDNKYVLDEFSRIEKIIYPDGTKLIAGDYDNKFNRPRQISFHKPSYDDIFINLGYDQKGRVTSVSYPDFSQGNISLTYDEAAGMVGGAPLPKLGMGRITSINDGNGSAEIYYTPNGSPVAVNRVIIGMATGHLGNPEDNGAARFYIKDGFLNTKSITYSGYIPVIINYSTDSAGRLAKVFKGPSWGGFGATIAEYHYNSDGQVSSIDYANGVSMGYNYLSSGRLRSIRIHRDDRDIFMETYKYDQRGNRAGVTYLDGSSVEYTYTLLGYLKSASYYKPHEMMPYYSQTYAYDQNGNRISYDDKKREINYSYDGELLDYYQAGRTRVDYKYDRWGNVSREEETYSSEKVITKEFDYDFKGNLASVKITNHKNGEVREINYKYDFKGRREVKEIAGGEITFYLYDQEDGLLSEWKQEGGKAGVHYDYVYAGGMPVATLVGDTLVGGETRYIHYDEMGTPRWVTNEEGKVIEANWYDPFGNISMHVGNTFSTGRFQGAIFDEETGLYYLNGHYYDPRIGRFVSKTRGSGGYTFASSNPLNDLSIVQLMNPPPAEKTPFYGVTGGDRFLENVAAAAKEGTDDFGGSGFICVESDISGSVELLEIFGTDFATNVRGCIDSTTPFGEIGNAMGGQVIGEATSELKKQALNGLIKDVAWKSGLMGGAFFGAIVGLAASSPIAGAIVGGAFVVGGAIFYAFTGNWTEFKAFFGFVDYVYMDHPPGAFEDVNMFSNGSNRFLDDPGKFAELTNLANLGADSLSIISGLADFGIIPIFENPLATVEPFGLRARIAQPMIPYRVNGTFNGGSLMGLVF